MIFKAQLEDLLNGRFDLAHLPLDVDDPGGEAVLGLVSVFAFGALLPQDLIQSAKRNESI